MRNFLAAGLLLAAALALAWPAAAKGGRKLHVYTWDTYYDAELFRKFKAETGISVIADVYSSNESMAAKLKTGGGYDVIVPSGNFVPLLIAEKLIQPLPEELRALGGSMNPNAQKPVYDPEYAYVLPLFYGTSGLAVNTKLVKEKIDSWGQFFNRPADEAPSLGVLDDMSTITNIASLYLDKPYCDARPDTLMRIQSLLQAQKPFVRVYGTTGYTERMAAGDVAMQLAWSGDIYTLRQDVPEIKFIYPREGVEVWIDNFAITADARNLDEAVAFIKFVMTPENSAAYSVSSGNMPAVAGAHGLLPAEMRDAPEFNVPASVKTPVTASCPPEVIAAYDKIWARLTQ